MPASVPRTPLKYVKNLGTESCLWSGCAVLDHCVQFQRGISLKEILYAELQALEDLLDDFE